MWESSVAGNISATHARAAAQIAGRAGGGRVRRERGTRPAPWPSATAPRPIRDLDAFLRHRPLDIVAIGSPSGLHGEQVEAAVAQGLHVLVEKPLEMTTARIDQMASRLWRGPA